MLIHSDTSITVEEIRNIFDPLELAKSLNPCLSSIPRTEKISEDVEDCTYEHNDDLSSDQNIYIPRVQKTDFEWSRTWSKITFTERYEEANKKNLNEQLYKEEMVGVGVPSTNECIKYSEVVLNFSKEEENFKCPPRITISEDKLKMDVPLIRSQGKRFFRFFYLNAHLHQFEDDSTVHLFGKTLFPEHGMYKSCCVIISPLKRRLFILPKINLEEQPDISERVIEIIKEFNILALQPINVKEFQFCLVHKRILDHGETELLLVQVEYSFQIDE